MDLIKPQPHFQSGWQQPMMTGSSSQAAPQKQGQPQMDFNGLSNMMGSMQRMNTPFETQMVKDAASGFGGMMQGAMGQLGSGLNANANRMQQNRDSMMHAAAGANPVPYGMDHQGFNDWMNQNANYRRRMMQLGSEQAGFDMRNQDNMWQQASVQRNQDGLDRMRYEMPYKQQMMSSLLNGMGGGGGGYSTNFGASGWF